MPRTDDNIESVFAAVHTINVLLPILLYVHTIRFGERRGFNT